MYKNKSLSKLMFAAFTIASIFLFSSCAKKIAFENCLFTVEAVDKKRVKQIKVTLDA